MRTKNGFTLTEVLITLGIIGILAAITIPRLFNNTKDAHVGAQFASAISAIETGAGLYLYEKGVKNTDYLNDTEFTPSELLAELANGRVKITSFKPDKPVSDICGSTAYTLPDRSIICVTADEALKPEPTLDEMKKRELAFISSKSTKQKVLVEGYDYFKMSVTGKGLIYLPGLDYDTSATCEAGVGGRGCSGVIAQNGWKIIYRFVQRE